MDYEQWFDTKRDRLISQFTEENPEIIGTDEDGQNIERNQQFQDWCDEQFKEEINNG